MVGLSLISIAIPCFTHHIEDMEKLIRMFPLLLVLLLCPNFAFAGHDYGQALSKSLLFFEAQRSGYLPHNQRVTWRAHSGLQDGKASGVSLRTLLLCDSMGDLCSRWDAMNNMLILQHTKLNASFQKNNNVVDHMFNTHFTRTYMALY